LGSIGVFHGYDDCPSGHVYYNGGMVMLHDICVNPVDGRIMPDDVRELQDQFNVNLNDADEWFDYYSSGSGHVTIIDEIEFWERYNDVF